MSALRARLARPMIAAAVAAALVGGAVALNGVEDTLTENAAAQPAVTDTTPHRTATTEGAAVEEGEDTTSQVVIPAGDSRATQARRGACGDELIPAFKVTVGHGGAEVTVPLPSGFLHHCTRGTGLRIGSEWAAYTPAPIGLAKDRLCNWRIDFVYRDLNNKVYKTVKGKNHPTCEFVGAVEWNAGNRTFKLGTSCAELWIAGTKRGAQCHNITR
ncbi:hypothetical protein ACWEQL_21130 [Kitasatospora sp. NPDC004240]